VAYLKGLLPNVPEPAVKLVARAETLSARGDRAGMRSTLEEATRLAPQAAYAQLQLASLYDADQQHDAAIDRYRRVIEVQPKSGIALNNLAYSLAVHRQAFDEALPLARRAVALGPDNAAFLDTLAWIEHLMGNHAIAATRIAVAVRRAPQSAELRLHSAAIHAAAGALAVAAADLKLALAMHPAYEGSELVKEVRSRLQQPAAPAK
jgi:Tfp pilus assembly protein PilF